MFFCFKNTGRDDTRRLALRVVLLRSSIITSGEVRKVGERSMANKALMCDMYFD